jgi:hypothetical protein
MLWISSRTSDLEQLCLIGYQISPLAAGHSGRAERGILADRLFTRILLKATSIVRLLRTDSCVPAFPNMIDVASVASLSRNMIEAYDVFFHVAVEKVPEEVQEFRSYLYTLHQTTDHDKIYSSFGRRTPHFGNLEFMGRFCKMRLEENAFFNSLPAGQQKELLKGKRPFLNLTASPTKKQYSDPHVLRGLYKFMSNSVHSHPLSIQGFRAPQSDDHLSIQHLLDMSIAAAAQHFAFAIDDYSRSRRRGRYISSEEKRFVRKQITLGPSVDPEVYELLPTS